MSANKGNMKPSSNDPDEACEWPDEVWDRAEIAVAGKVVRPAAGTLTRRGRPPIGNEPKKQVTLRLPSEVIEHFRAGGKGWQSRIGDVLVRHIDDARGRRGVAEEREAYRGEEEN
ncbi:MAG TPA: BrnA antitoxin family protein [Allosphingosinicella sp.]|nr:BrnA antitoxin family protein [Allosphingosinicella sp.]